MPQFNQERATNKVPNQDNCEPKDSAHEARALDGVRQAQHAGTEGDVDDVEDSVEGTSVPAGGGRGWPRRGYEPAALHAAPAALDNRTCGPVVPVPVFPSTDRACCERKVVGTATPN